ncbi:30783_t:CDS:2 [Racocetra persica]|uniref:30783_t:CDS:1 n=1 Tax=Racocetra persica TaxID=160502 RepID=A0ACA9NCD5_9GLOM|nr:30783_t:CDS:2 [Racocetra persica]
MLKLPIENSEMCCSNEKVGLAKPIILPLLLQLYFNQDDVTREFCYKIRLYNSAFIFTSLGVNLDRNLANARKSIYTFRVQVNMKNLVVRLHTNIHGLDQRTQNAPTASQVQRWAPCQILYRNITIKHEQVESDENEINYDDEEPDDNNSTFIRCRKFVSAIEYYAYQLQIWPQCTNILLQTEDFSSNIC